VIAAGAILYLPALGLYSLWDPWETHYGEVAREILARDDWISLWWAQDGWFWSKPVLNFWLQAIAMATLGTHYESDHVLLDPSGRPTLHPEWVVRAPNVLLAVLAMYALYKGVAKVFGRRAGLIGGLILATLPDWYFLAQQTMTDMPCVASMTIAMGLILLGVHTGDSELVRLYEVRTGKLAWRLSAWHLVFGAVLLTALPQILYLVSRNIDLMHGGGAHYLGLRWDRLHSGSAGNCGLPGNIDCAFSAPALVGRGGFQASPHGLGQEMRRIVGALEPAFQAFLWTSVLALVLRLNWGERRVQRLFYVAAWYFAALATMAKGPEGVAIPAVTVLVWVCVKRRWSELLRLEIVTGAALWTLLVLPWLLAMYVRHGPPFVHQLIFHDMFDRAVHHVLDTNEGDDTSIRYYVWQLGYALYPWTALAPLGLLYWLRGSDSEKNATGDATVLLFMWFFLTFALVTFMGTKFHHYIFPSVPAIAMLIGIALDGILAADSSNRRSSVHRAAREIHEPAMVGAAAAAGALLLLLVGRDLAIKPEGADQPGAIRLLQLFTYFYRRSWPENVDFSGALLALTVAGALAAAGMASCRWRRWAVALFGVVAALSALWGVDIYMVRMARHWGQRRLIEAYYASRAGPDEMLVAYQMNWKGENFYTGNHLPAFVSTGSPFTGWMRDQREKGTKVMFFVTDYAVLDGLKSEVQARSYREITDKDANCHFVVVRAEL
jgi:4-amino-4-deoxy-L-arabinose transferase-like glycosyltransferase